VSDMFLNSNEIASMTARVQCAAQVRVLRSMGIEHRCRPDGSVAVLRAHVEQTFGNAQKAKRAKGSVEPNWGALNAALS